MNVYVVIENGDPYPFAYMNYTAAVDAVKLKHKEAIEEELDELLDLDEVDEEEIEEEEDEDDAE